MNQDSATTQELKIAFVLQETPERFFEKYQRQIEDIIVKRKNETENGTGSSEAAKDICAAVYAAMDQQASRNVLKLDLNLNTPYINKVFGISAERYNELTDAVGEQLGNKSEGRPDYWGAMIRGTAAARTANEFALCIFLLGTFFQEQEFHADKESDSLQDAAEKLHDMGLPTELITSIIGKAQRMKQGERRSGSAIEHLVDALFGGEQMNARSRGGFGGETVYQDENVRIEVGVMKDGRAIPLDEFISRQNRKERQGQGAPDPRRKPRPEHSTMNPNIQMTDKSRADVESLSRMMLSAIPQMLSAKYVGPSIQGSFQNGTVYDLNITRGNSGTDAIRLESQDTATGMEYTKKTDMVIDWQLETGGGSFEERKPDQGTAGPHHSSPNA